MQALLVALQAQSDKALWARPSRVLGLEWVVKSVGNGHSVKLVDCSDQASRAQQQAVHELLELVSAAGSETLRFRCLRRVVLARSRAREKQLLGKMMDLNFKYANKALFSLEQRMRLGSAIDVDARRRTLDWFHDTYRSLIPGYPNVRTLLAFHATPSEEIAEQVRGSRATSLAFTGPRTLVASLRCCWATLRCCKRSTRGFSAKGSTSRWTPSTRSRSTAGECSA
jgi:hypothetical protein